MEIQYYTTKLKLKDIKNGSLIEQLQLLKPFLQHANQFARDFKQEYSRSNEFQKDLYEITISTLLGKYG
jgi:hypothetical protein